MTHSSYRFVLVAMGVLSTLRTSLALQLGKEKNTEMTLKHVDAALAKQMGAYCIDGETLPNFYWDPARTTNPSTKWLLTFKGGGFCNAEETCGERFVRTFQPKLVPDKTMRAFYQGDKWADYNFVQLNYCDGAFFIGDREEVVNGLYFRGRPILDAIIETLFQDYGLADATDVVLTGTSSGGMATYLNADYLATKFDASVKYSAVPFSGFFMPRGEYLEAFKSIYDLHGVAKNLPKACMDKMAKDDQWQCLFPVNFYDSIETPMFPVQSVLDGYQVQHFQMTDLTPVRCMIGGVKKYTDESCTGESIDSLNEIIDSFTNGFQQTNKSQKQGEGGYLLSCPEHNVIITMFDSIKIDDMTIEDAILDWLAQDRSAPAKWYMPCNLNKKPEPAYQCNPTCKDAILGASVE